jgi:aspartate-semialdehyde dehydrogenase
MRAHSIAVIAEFERPFDLRTAQQVLDDDGNVDYFPGDTFPSPMERSMKDRVAVGRLRVDTFSDNGASMWIVGDQIRKGAALNALQIMEFLESEKFRKPEALSMFVRGMRFRAKPKNR